MFRIYIPIVFFALFIVWIAYHWLFAKDLKKQIPTLLLGSFFTIIWVLIYAFTL